MPMSSRAGGGDQEPRLPLGHVVVLHAPRHAHQAEHVERHEGDVEADDPEPERRLAQALVQAEAERLGKPVLVAGEHAEHHAADDDVVEVGDEEQAVVEHEVGRRHGEQHAGHAADDEGDHEAERPQHRRREDDAAAVHREQPVVDLHARGHGDDHGGDAEDRIDVGARAHGEEVVQPDHEGEDADRHRRRDHRAVAEQRLARERGEHLREDAERRQHQDVDLGVPPGPDEVHEHHRVAAGLVGEEVEAEIAVEQEHRQGGGEDRERGDDEQVGGERGPAEDRHAQVGHARRAHLEHGRHEVDARSAGCRPPRSAAPRGSSRRRPRASRPAPRAADRAASRCARTRR